MDVSEATTYSEYVNAYNAHVRSCTEPDCPCFEYGPEDEEAEFWPTVPVPTSPYYRLIASEFRAQGFTPSNVWAPRPPGIDSRGPAIMAYDPREVHDRHDGLPVICCGPCCDWYDRDEPYESAYGGRDWRDRRNLFDRILYRILGLD